jgi:hypothetical protein
MDGKMEASREMQDAIDFFKGLEDSSVKDWLRR